MKLQQRIGIEKQEYSDALVKELFSETNGDLEMFLEDRSSELVKKNFATDQRVAKDMGITITPSSVVYDFSSEEEYGVFFRRIRGTEKSSARLWYSNRTRYIFAKSSVFESTKTFHYS